MVNEELDAEFSSVRHQSTSYHSAEAGETDTQLVDAPPSFDAEYGTYDAPAKNASLPASVDRAEIHWPLHNAYYAGHVASVSDAGHHSVR